MNVKNRYYFRTRIREAKFRQLIRCFSLDFTAASTAQLTGISIRSVNTIYLKVRQRIAHCCERESPLQGSVEIDESYFGAQRVRGKRGRGTYGKRKDHRLRCSETSGKSVYRDRSRLF